MRSQIWMLMILLAGTGVALDAAPKDDAYHYMRNGIDDHLYNEWWYFNGVANGSQFVVTYLIGDPDNITSQRRIQVQAVLLEDGRAPVVAVHHSRGFGGDRSSPTFEVDRSGFMPEDERGLSVWGQAEDTSTGEPVSWELLYEPAADPFFGIPVQSRVGHLEGDWARWLVYMPSAHVKGTFHLQDRTVDVSGVGYHDHWWGRFDLSDPEILWAQASKPEEGLSLALGEVRGEQRAVYIVAALDGEEVGFSGGRAKLNVTALSFDPQTSRIYPSAYTVEADNGEWRLNMTVRSLKAVPLILAATPPAPSPLIFYQVSLIEGTLISRSGEERSFDLMGLSGFVTRRLHPIYGRVSLTGVHNVTAANERTGQRKEASATADGWFSIDADYDDYMANSTSPWISEGDRVLLEADGTRVTLEVEMELDGQRADI